MAESLNICTRGEGPELVLLHGWAMHSGIWGGIVDGLASGFRVNLVDLPGHGINRHIPLSPDLNEVAGLILSELPPAIWIGWSLGGLVTLAAALLQPHKVQKTVLVAATPCFSRQANWDSGVSVEAMQAFGEGLESDLVGTLRQFYLQTFGASRVNEALQRLGQASVTDNLPTKNVLQTSLQLLYDNNLLTEIGACKVPALFLGGTRDRTIRPESFTRAAALMPDAGSHCIQAAGHAPFISHQDRFLSIIHGYLKGDQTA